TQFFWRGVVLVGTGGSGVSLVPTRDTAFYSAMVGRVGGAVPAQMLWTVFVALLMGLLLNRHRFGAHVYLIGDNIESARLRAINAGVVAIGLTGFWTQLIYGLIIVISVTLQTVLSRRLT